MKEKTKMMLYGVGEYLEDRAKRLQVMITHIKDGDYLAGDLAEKLPYHIKALSTLLREMKNLEYQITEDLSDETK